MRPAGAGPAGKPGRDKKIGRFGGLLAFAARDA